MNKQQKAVIEHQLAQEKAVLEKLEKQYKEALRDIELKIRYLQSDPLTQSRIYRIEYQKTLKKQIEAILEKLHSDEYTSIQQYLSDSYTDGFVGAMYDMHGQGVPVIAPIDQNAAIKAVMTDSKLSEPLYNALGVDVNNLKKSISQEISRGIASGLFYDEIARNIQFFTNAPLSRAKTIVRTEAHRIQEASAEDARQKAKARGADVVKQWDATLDGNTRPTHRELDGQIRELDKPFEANGKKAMYPGDFGVASEDCNCRCVALTRARAALDEDELKILRERAAIHSLYMDDPKTYRADKLPKLKNFTEFKKSYLKAAEKETENERREATLLPPEQPKKQTENSGATKHDKGIELDKREQETLAEIQELEKNIGRYDAELKAIGKKEEGLFDLEEIVKLEEEYDAVATKRNQDVSRMHEIKKKLDTIRHDKAWYKFEKPYAELQSIEEVEQAIVNSGWFEGKVSLAGIDLENAKTISASLNRVFDTYPEMRGKVKRLVTVPTKNGAWASFDPNTESLKISQGVYSKPVKELASSYERTVESGWFPKGTDHRSIFVHEMGHAIDFFVGAKKGVDRIAYAMQYEYLEGVAGLRDAYSKKADEYIEAHVSGYAKTNQKELFAECFSEYLTAQHPREMAQWYGDVIEREVREVLGK